MNVGASVQRLLDVSGKKALRFAYSLEPRGRRPTVATLAASVLLTPARATLANPPHGRRTCPHCGALR